MSDEKQNFDKQNHAQPSNEAEPDPDVEVLEPREITEGCDPPQTKDGNKD